MKKISVLCLVLLIIALVGVQVVGNETDQLATKETNETKVERKTESSEKDTNVKAAESEKKEISEEIQTVKIRMENGYDNSLNNLDDFKERLKSQKVQIILTYKEQVFAKGYIGLNEEKNSLKFIYFAHTEHQEKPVYVKKYNQFRKEIYNVKY
ncbi:MAG: hypothetical protein ACQEP3_00120 [Patescibacteria group bacterium]